MKLQISNCGTHHKCRIAFTMPNFVAIGQTVVEISRFWIFQDGGSRHFGFSKLQIYNGRNGQEGRTASACQISSKSVKPWLRYGNFLFFKIAAAAILDFWNFKFLTVWSIKTIELRQRAKFRQNRSNRGWDMAIFIFQDGGTNILDFRNFLFLTVRTVKSVELHQLTKFRQNRSNRGRDMAIFQRWRLPPSWICNACVGTTHEGHLVVSITVQSLRESASFEPSCVKIRRRVWPVGEFPKKGISNISPMCSEAPVDKYLPNLAQP